MQALLASQITVWLAFQRVFARYGVLASRGGVQSEVNVSLLTTSASLPGY